MNCCERGARAKRWLRSVAATMLLAPSGVRADTPEASPHVVVGAAIRLPREPSRASVVCVTASNGTRVYEALWVPPFRKAEPERGAGGEQSQEWVFGGFCEVAPEDASLSYSVIAEVEGGQRASSGVQVVSRERFERVDDAARQKEQLARQRNVLKTTSVELEAQEQSLRRLRADSDLIADLDKILEVRAELRRVRIEFERASANLAVLERASELSREREVPGRIVSIEQELGKQIAELNERVTLAVRGEYERRVAHEGKVQQDLSAMESTRYDDPSKLEAELERLRGQGQGRDFPGAELPPAPDYWDIE